MVEVECGHLVDQRYRSLRSSVKRANMGDLMSCSYSWPESDVVDHGQIGPGQVSLYASWHIGVRVKVGMGLMAQLLGWPDGVVPETRVSQNDRVVCTIL